MAQQAESPFEDEAIAANEAVVDEVIRLAGGAREAVRALLIERGEMSAALEAARAGSSLGFAHGRQPERPSA